MLDMVIDSNEVLCSQSVSLSVSSKGSSTKHTAPEPKDISAVLAQSTLPAL